LIQIFYLYSLEIIPRSGNCGLEYRINKGSLFAIKNLVARLFLIETSQIDELTYIPATDNITGAK